MQLLQPSGTSVVIVAVFTAALCQGAHGQGTPAPAAQSKTAPAIEAARLPPRATAAEYQARAQAGAVTIGAEFTAHSVATLQATLATEDYVVVEVGLFGQPDARLKLSHEDFSLRVNGKKALLLAQPYLLVFKSLKDPEWEPPASKAKKDSSDAESDGRLCGGRSWAVRPAGCAPQAIPRGLFAPRQREEGAKSP